MIHPAQDHLVIINPGCGSKRAISRFAFLGRINTVNPRPKQEVSPWIRFRFASPEQTLKVGRSSFGTIVVVIPRGKIQHTSVNVRIFVAEFGPAPPRVFRWMAEPVVVIRSDSLQLR